MYLLYTNLEYQKLNEYRNQLSLFTRFELNEMLNW